MILTERYIDSCRKEMSPHGERDNISDPGGIGTERPNLSVHLYDSSLLLPCADTQKSGFS